MIVRVLMLVFRIPFFTRAVKPQHGARPSTMLDITRVTRCPQYDRSSGNDPRAYLISSLMARMAHIVIAH